MHFFRDSIHHSILLTNELLQRALESGVDHIFLKLDICKAFHKLEWAFLYRLLKHLGFDPRFINFVKAISASENSIVIMNGKQSEPFKISHSVRQGCPFSPLLFIIVVDALSQMLDRALSRGQIRGVYLPNENLHLLDNLYADDINLIFTAQLSNVIPC